MPLSRPGRRPPKASIWLRSRWPPRWGPAFGWILPRSSSSATPLFSSLRQAHFRIFLAGAFLSNIGTWMQTVAESWMVLQLTDSAFYLGLNGFANTIPLALFAFSGGVIADHFDRRKLLIGTQWGMLATAVMLTVLTYTGRLSVHQIIALSFVAGLLSALAWPAYQAVIAGLVPSTELSNAIALNSTQFNVARLLGPLAGAWGMKHLGAAGCFGFNAVSFLAVLAALYGVRELQRDRRQSPQPGFVESFREGIAYYRGEPVLFGFLMIMAMTSLLGVPWVTLLPVFARDILHSGVSGFGTLVGAFGGGAIAAGLLVAWLGSTSRRGYFVTVCLWVFCAAQLLFTFSTHFPLSIICLAAGGFCMVGFASMINTIIQSATPDHMRGRAISAFVFAFGGLMPFGNLLAGSLARAWGAPAALQITGIGLTFFAGYLALRHPELRQHP